MDARSARLHTAASALPALAAVLALTGPAGAQTSRPETAAPPDDRPAIVPGPGDDADGDRRRERPPLLREGSQLVQVTGIVSRDETDGAWIFTIDPAGAAVPRYELTLMPSSLLGETERMIGATADNLLVFEITGQVYVYRERNYLMPTHPPLLIRQEIDHTEPAPETRPAASRDTTEDIIRNLERSVGPVPRRGVTDRRAPFGSAEDDGAIAGPALEGTILVERRGVVRRTAGGGYVLLFDADAEGNADPPMRLLPCLLLQELERYARQHGERAAVLVSGHVYTYRGLNYLRPTLFRIPQDRTRLQP